MDAIGIVAGSLFAFGYVLIALEQKFGTHKSAIALMMAGVLWLLAAVHLGDNHEKLDHALAHTANDIFGIVAFVLAAMALIEILVHYGLFDLVRAKLIKLKVSDKQQFLVIMTLTFFFSAVLDNIAITIAMLQVARRFFTGRNMIVAAAGIVIAANAGGAWSPIGDITTVLLWLAEKFSALQVVQYAFLPCLSLFGVATALLYRQLDDSNYLRREKGDTADLSLSEKIVVGTALASFSLPLVMSTVGLPPYLGLLFGLGVTWGVVELAKKRSRHEHQSHLTANIDKIIQTVDISSVKYILGILLAVGALSTLGVLLAVSEFAVGQNPGTGQLIGANIGLGLLSGIVDNASLVAIAISALPITSPEIWSLTAILAGNGGSLMVIASAAGVVAMGNYKQLTVGEYLRIATVPAFLGLIVSFLVWLAQYKFL